MGNVTIITLADGEYFKMLLSMVRSLSHHCKGAGVHAILVNSTDKQEAIIRKAHDKITVVRDDLSFSSDSEKRCYCTNRRGYLFKKMRSKLSGHLVWIDADSIFRKNCDSFMSHVSSCELTMRPKDLKKGTFAAGVIGIGDSLICHEFIEDYYDAVNKDKDWMSNQRNLNKTYWKYRKKINYKVLDKKYCDVWMSDGGVLWCAKSKLHKSKKYRLEIDKYK
jgi:hypothetical protein